MSQLTFHGKDLQQKFGEATKLATVFRHIEAELKAVNEVVCQFKVNGIALDEAGERKFSDSTLTEIQIIEVTSERPAILLHEVLNNWVNQIPGMIQRNDQLSSDFRFKGMEGQMKPLVDLIDDCQLLIDSLLSIQTVFSEMKYVQSEEWLGAQSKMSSAVGEVLAAFQSKNTTLLADILEYDMGHSLQLWLDTLTNLRQNLGSAHTENVRNNKEEND
jgi:hypothetical protein